MYYYVNIVSFFCSFMNYDPKTSRQLKDISVSLSISEKSYVR